MIKRVPALSPLIKHLFELNKAENAEHSSVKVDRPGPTFFCEIPQSSDSESRMKFVVAMVCGGIPRSPEEPALSGFSLFSSGGKVVENWSLVGGRSFQSANGSVDGEAHNCNHSRAQRHSQPEGGAAHI